MKIRVINFLIASIAILAFSTSAYAGCTTNQVSGVWETAFSDGNSCRFKINAKGNIVASASICFDPSAGAIAPESGTLVVGKNCLAEGSFVVMGVTTELAIQISTDRSIGAGRYLLPASGDKGSVVMVRVP